MNSRTLLLLLAALAVLVALAVAVSVSQRPADVAGGALLPDLKAQLNDVDRIVVRAAGNRTVATLERRDDRWVVAERDGYPADVGRIRRNLIALAEARILEEKTSNPELYGRLKVDDVERDSAGGVRLDLRSAGKETGVIVGTTNVGGGDRAYVRRAGEPTSWLVSGALDAPTDAADWLDRTVVDLDPARVHSVTIAHPGGATLRLRKDAPGAGDFTVLDVPAGRELSFPTVGNAIGAGLADLTLESVEPAAAFAPGDAAPVVATFETFDGLVVEARTWRLPAGARTRFSARVDEALAARFAPPPVPATTDGAKDGEAAGAADAAAKAAGGDGRKSLDEVKAEAADLAARLGDWVYALPDFKAEQLVKKPDELLAPR
jgi:hypothetical protein